jgi:hypothetical protein
VRFRLDGHDGEIGQPNPPQPTASAPLLDRRESVEFLKLVHDGLGRTMACTQLGIGLKSLRRTLAKRPGFRRALEQVEQVRADNLYSVLYEAALRGDTRAARFLLARHDRHVARRHADRNRPAER